MLLINAKEKALICKMSIIPIIFNINGLNFILKEVNLY